MRPRSAASPSWRCWWCASRTGCPGRAGGSAARRSTAMPGRGKGPKAAKLIRKLQRAGVRLLGEHAGLASHSLRARHDRPWPNARTFTVSEDDDGIRLDRWFKRHMPDVSFNLVSRWARTGQLRLDGKRAAPGDRIEAGQEIRIPPADAAPARPARPQPEREPLTDDEAAVRPRHGDPQDARRVRAQQAAGAGDAGRDQDAPASRPAARRAGRRGGHGPSWSTGSTRTRRARCWSRGRARAAGHFAKAFSGRTARKVYWALVVGVPVGRGGHDRRAARQAARHRRREDACRRGTWACRRRPAGG